MTPSEATTLARLARAACPQQHFDEYTPDMWFDLLSDLNFEDCRQALARAAREKPFVAPAEIRAHVRKLRAERLANADLAIPPIDPDLPGETYQKRYRAHLAAIADGRAPAGAITAGGKRPPRPDISQALTEARRQCAEVTAQRRGEASHGR